MYLHPDSNLLGGATETQTIPPFLQHLLIDGLIPKLLQANGFYLLTQHYDHPDIDLYIHHIKASKDVRLFAKAAADRWVLGYLNKGRSITMHFYDGHQLQAVPQSVLFFKMCVGKEIHIDVEVDQYEMICCCLKPTFENVLRQYYPSLLQHDQIEKKLSNAICQHPIFWVRYQWLELLHNVEPASLYPSFIAEKVRTLLRHLATESWMEKKRKEMQQLHPDIPMAIVEKAYFTKKIIDTSNGEHLSLMALVRKTQWNLQGLKAGFVQVFGISPHQYIIQHRMNLALTLVQQTKEPIRVIALLCGYKQAHHFIQQFKQAYGITPGEMRRESY